MSTYYLFSKVCWQRPAMFCLLHIKQTFQPIIWIFTVGEGDEIQSRLPFLLYSNFHKLWPFKYIYFFPFFSRSILARTCNDTVWHHQQTIIRGIDDTTCTVKMFIFLYMFDRKGGSSSIYSPCFETTFTCRLPPHAPPPSNVHLDCFLLQITYIYLLPR